MEKDIQTDHQIFFILMLKNCKNIVQYHGTLNYCG